MSISLSKEQRAIFHFDELIARLRKKDIVIVGHVTHWNTSEHTLTLAIALEPKEAMKELDLPSDIYGFPVKYVYMNDMEFASYS